MKFYLPDSSNPRTGDRQYIVKKNGEWYRMQENHHDFDSQLYQLKEGYALDAMLEYFQRGMNKLLKGN